MRVIIVDQAFSWEALQKLWSTIKNITKMQDVEIDEERTSRIIFMPQAYAKQKVLKQQ
jgi:hypothetical protein